MKYRLWVGFNSGNSREWSGVEEEVREGFDKCLVTGEPIVMDGPKVFSVIMPGTVEYAIFREEAE